MLHLVVGNSAGMLQLRGDVNYQQCRFPNPSQEHLGWAEAAQICSGRMKSSAGYSEFIPGKEGHGNPALSQKARLEGYSALQKGDFIPSWAWK